MKLSEAKAICADIFIDPKSMKCTYLQTNDRYCSCPHAQHFVCEIVLFKEGLDSDRRAAEAPVQLIGKKDHAAIVARLRKQLPHQDLIDTFKTRARVNKTSELRADSMDRYERILIDCERELIWRNKVEETKREDADRASGRIDAAPVEPGGGERGGNPPAAQEGPTQGNASTVAPDAPVQDSTEPIPEPEQRDATIANVATRPQAQGSWDKLWSYSRIECAMDCPRKFWLRYVGRVPETNPSKAFAIGKAFHAGREAIDIGSTVTDAMLGDLELDDAIKLSAVLAAYDKLRPLKIDESEVRINIELFDGTPIVGYIDGVNATTVYEFKYAVDATNYTRALMARQAAVYLTGRPEVGSFACVKALKPQQRRKKDETDLAFTERVLAAAMKEDPFEIRTWPRDLFDTTGTLGEMTHAVGNARDFMRRAVADGVKPPASRSVMKCPGCGYFDLCEVLDGDRREEADSGLLYAALEALSSAKINGEET